MKRKHINTKVISLYYLCPSTPRPSCGVKTPSVAVRANPIRPYFIRNGTAQIVGLHLVDGGMLFALVTAKNFINLVRHVLNLFLIVPAF
jgi:hypothetical protein